MVYGSRNGNDVQLMTGNENENSQVGPNGIEEIVLRNEKRMVQEIAQENGVSSSEMSEDDRKRSKMLLEQMPSSAPGMSESLVVNALKHLREVSPSFVVQEASYLSVEPLPEDGYVPYRGHDCAVAQQFHSKMFETNILSRSNALEVQAFRVSENYNVFLVGARRAISEVAACVAGEFYGRLQNVTLSSHPSQVIVLLAQVDEASSVNSLFDLVRVKHGEQTIVYVGTLFDIERGEFLYGHSDTFVASCEQAIVKVEQAKSTCYPPALKHVADNHLSPRSTCAAWTMRGPITPPEPVLLRTDNLDLDNKVRVIVDQSCQGMDDECHSVAVWEESHPVKRKDERFDITTTYVVVAKSSLLGARCPLHTEEDRAKFVCMFTDATLDLDDCPICNLNLLPMEVNPHLSKSNNRYGELNYLKANYGPTSWVGQRTKYYVRCENGPYTPCVEKARLHNIVLSAVGRNDACSYYSLCRAPRVLPLLTRPKGAHGLAKIAVYAATANYPSVFTNKIIEMYEKGYVLEAKQAIEFMQRRVKATRSNTTYDYELSVPPTSEVDARGIHADLGLCKVHGTGLCPTCAVTPAKVARQIQSGSLAVTFSKIFYLNMIDSAILVSYVTSLVSTIVAWGVHNDTPTKIAMVANICGFILLVVRAHKMQEGAFTQVQQLVERAFETSGMQVQVYTVKDGIKKAIGCIIAGVVAIAGMTIIEKLPTVDRFVAAVNKLSRFSQHGLPWLNDISDWAISMIFGDDSPQAASTKETMEVVDNIDAILKIPPSSYLLAPWKIKDLHELKKRALTRLVAIGRSDPMYNVLLNSQTALSKKIVEYARLMDATNVRVTPTCLCFFGPAAIGKSSAKAAFATRLNARRYNNNPGNTYELNSSVKYYPEYIGQAITLIQEFMKSQNLAEERVANELTSLISPAPHNIQGAEAEHKAQMFRSECVLIDTNSDPVDMGKRLSAILIEASISAWLSRITFVKCTWNGPNEDLMKPREQRSWDKTGNFNHIRFQIQRHMGRKMTLDREFITIPLEVALGSKSEDEIKNLIRAHFLKQRNADLPENATLEGMLALAQDRSTAAGPHFLEGSGLTINMNLAELMEVEHHDHVIHKRQYENTLKAAVPEVRVEVQEAPVLVVEEPVVVEVQEVPLVAEVGDEAAVAPLPAIVEEEAGALPVVVERQEVVEEPKKQAEVFQKVGKTKKQKAKKEKKAEAKELDVTPDFIPSMTYANKAKSGPSREVQAGVHHLVCHIAGRAGVGKTAAIMPAIKVFFRTNVYTRDHVYDYSQVTDPRKIKCPSVIICDDVMLNPTPEKEREYNEWYNRLPTGCLLVHFSNHVPSEPSRSYLKRMLSNNYFCEKYNPIYTLPATYRRMGVSGCFNCPGYDDVVVNNQLFFIAESSTLVVEGKKMVPIDFARYLGNAYARYKNKGFDFNFSVVDALPPPTGIPITFSSPNMKTMREDVADLMSVFGCLNGLKATRITLSSTDKETFSRSYARVLVGAPDTTDPQEICKFYARHIRTLGIDSDIVVDIGDVASAIVVANTIYTTTDLSMKTEHLEFQDMEVRLNGISHGTDEICAMVLDTSYRNLQAPAFLSVSTYNKLVEWVSSGERREKYIDYIRNHTVDPCHKLEQKSLWKKVEEAWPWLLGAAAGVVTLWLLVKALLPVPSNEELEAHVTKLIANGEEPDHVNTPPVLLLHSEFDSAVLKARQVQARARALGVARKVDKPDHDTGSPQQFVRKLGYERSAELWREFESKIEPDWTVEYAHKRFEDVLEKEARRGGGMSLNAYKMRREEDNGYNAVTDLYSQVIKPNMCRISGVVHGIFLKGRYCIAPHHVLALDPNPTITVTIRQGEEEVDKTFPARIVKVYPDRDLILLECLGGQMYRDITKHLADEQEMGRLHAVTLAVPAFAGDRFYEGKVFEFYHHKTNYGDEECPIDYAKWGEVKVARSVPRVGDCGSPYFINVRGIVRIIGIHTASSLDERTMVYSALSFQDASEVLAQVGKVEEPKEMQAGNNKNWNHFCEEIQDPSVQLEGPKYVTACKVILSNNFPNKDIYPLGGPRIEKIASLVSDASKVMSRNEYVVRNQARIVRKHFGPPQKVPILSPASLVGNTELDLDGFGRPSQIQTNVKHLEKKHMVAMDPMVRKHVITQVANWLDTNYGKFCKEATLQEVVQGCDLEDGAKMEHLVMSSSTGYFAKNLLGFGTKSMFYKQEKTLVNGIEEIKYVVKESPEYNAMIALYEDTMCRLKKGERPLHLFTTTRKTELLMKEKAHKGRVFEAPNVEWTLAERAIFGKLCAALSTWDVRNPICVGMNTGHDFDELFRHHATFRYHGAVDFVKWDKTIPVELADMLEEVLALVGEPEWNVPARAVIHTLFRSNRAIGNSIYRVEGSMPSGSAITAPFNSLINFMIDVYVCTCLMGPVPLEEMFEHMRSSVFGDDKYLSWDSTFDKKLNMVTYKDIVESHLGMRVDSDKKDGTLLARTENISDLSFLSRTPIRQSRIGWVGVLKKESVLAQLYWARKDQDTPNMAEAIWKAVFSEGARHGKEFHQQLVDCYKEIRTKVPGMDKLAIPPTWEESVLDLLTQIKGLKESSRVGYKIQMMNRQRNVQPRVFPENDAPMGAPMPLSAGGAVHASGPAGKLMVIDDGMSMPEVTMEMTPLMNNAQKVDDGNDLTAALMNAPPLMQAVPEKFAFDAWNATWAGNTEIQRQFIQSTTAVGTVLFNYSSDISSPDFPNQTPEMQALTQIIALHKFYVADFRIKNKYIGAAGQIGRVLVAVLPTEYNLEGNGTVGIVAGIKRSHFDYSEISANGDSTYVACLRPYTNMGFASTTNGAGGVGQIVENVKVICVVSELFSNTFNDQGANVAVTTEFSFGDQFRMSVPLGSLLDLIIPAAANRLAIERPKMTISGKFHLGDNLTVRVGSATAANFSDGDYNPPTEDIPEFGGLGSTYLSPNDCIACYSDENEFMIPVFARGTLPFAWDYELPPNDGETMYAYLTRMILASQPESLEISTILNEQGEKNIDLTYSTTSTKEYLELAGYNTDLLKEDVTAEYVWRVIYIRNGAVGGFVFWPEFEDTDASFEGGFVNSTTAPGTRLNLATDSTIHQTGPTFLPVVSNVMRNPFASVNVAVVGARVPQFVAARAPYQDQSVTMVIGTSVTDAVSTGQYKTLTLTTAKEAVLAAVGTGSIVSPAHTRMVYKASQEVRVIGTADLLDEVGLLVAHILVDVNGNTYINSNREFIARQIAGGLYLANVSRNANETLAATPTDNWVPYTTATRRNQASWKKVDGELVHVPTRKGRGFKVQAGILGGILGGVASGIGGAVTANVNHKYDMENTNLEWDRRDSEQQQQLKNELDKINTQGGVQSGLNEAKFGYDTALSNQKYQNDSAITKQNYNQSVQMRGLADPSQLGSPKTTQQRANNGSARQVTTGASGMFQSNRGPALRLQGASGTRVQGMPMSRSALPSKFGAPATAGAISRA